jgi:hypothetical protein
VEPLLFKGWAVAQLYPEKGLRPYGDIDLCVHPSQYQLAETLLSSEDPECRVDLHPGFEGSNDRAHDAFWTRSRLVRLGEVDIRVPGLEDHLRLLCCHLLRHGAWRPLWLCDIALVVESRSPDFDWDYCLGSNRRRADWVACAIGLAHHLLGAKVDDTPAAGRAAHLPPWLVPAVLKQWAILHRFRVPIVGAFFNHPMDGIREVLHRWPDPIVATSLMGGPFNELPRLPFQVAEFLWQCGEFFGRLPGALWKEAREHAGRLGHTERGA